MKHVESPCIGLCQIDEEDICIGCYRSIDEIAGWSAASATQQHRIVEVAERRKALAEQQSKTKKCQ